MAAGRASWPGSRFLARRIASSPMSTRRGRTSRFADAVSPLWTSLASSVTTIAYTVSEMSVVGRPMLDFSNGQNTGTLTAGTPTICVTTKPSQPFPLESYATIDFVNQATNAPVKRVTLHLAPQLVIVQDVHLLTQIDRINGQVCETGVSLPFTLSQRARVTIKVDGTVVVQNLTRPEIGRAHV